MEKAFTCKYCGESIPFGKMLIRHMHDMHPVQFAPYQYGGRRF